MHEEVRRRKCPEKTSRPCRLHKMGVEDVGSPIGRYVDGSGVRWGLASWGSSDGHHQTRDL